MEAAGDELIGRRLRQHVAGELLDGELVERHVVVERLDHPIAILPHCPQVVLFVAVAVGVAGKVEPGTSPAFAVMRRGEEPVDHTLVGVRGGVREKGVGLCRRGRQADQIQRHTAQEGLSRGLMRGLEALFLESREHELIDGIAHPIGLLDRRRRRRPRRDVGPVFGGRGRGVCRRCGRRRRAIVGPGCPMGDPVPDEPDLRIGEGRLVERHAIFAVQSEKPPDEDALIGIAGDDHRSGDAALQGGRTHVESKAGAALLRSVALVAVRFQNRPHVAGEVDGGRLLAGRCARGWRDCSGSDGQYYCERGRQPNSRKVHGTPEF